MSFSTPIQAGSLNRVVQVQERSNVVDDFGQQQLVWNTVLTARASVEPLSGTEVVAAGALLGQTMLSVTMRYRPSINVGMRLVYEGAIYNILNVLDDQARHRKLTLTCSEGTTRG